MRQIGNNYIKVQEIQKVQGDFYRKPQLVESKLSQTKQSTSTNVIRQCTEIKDKNSYSTILKQRPR